MIQSSEAKAVDVLKLKQFFADKPDGTILSWVEIEMATGVKTASPGSPGRQRATAALREMGRPYQTLSGRGLSLTTDENCHEPVLAGVRRTIRAGRRVERTAKTVMAHHANMSSHCKNLIVSAVGFAGAVRANGAMMPKITVTKLLAQAKEV